MSISICCLFPQAVKAQQTTPYVLYDMRTPVSAPVVKTQIHELQTHGFTPIVLVSQTTNYPYDIIYVLKQFRAEQGIWLAIEDDKHTIDEQLANTPTLRSELFDAVIALNDENGVIFQSSLQPFQVIAITSDQALSVQQYDETTPSAWQTLLINPNDFNMSTILLFQDLVDFQPIAFEYKTFEPVSRYATIERIGIGIVSVFGVAITGLTIAVVWARIQTAKKFTRS